MSLALGLVRIFAPPGLKKMILKELYLATARAFEVAPPAGLDRLSHASLLESYAAFTTSEAGRLLGDPARAARAEERLFDEARALGEAMRRALRLRTGRDILAASRVVYAALGIDFEGRETGEAVIRRCYFSRFYTAGICKLMSSADAGAAAGLSGGGRLVFSQRITQGAEACLARLDLDFLPGRAGR